MQHKNWSCIKCGYNNYEIGDNAQGAILIKIPHQLSNNIFELPNYQDIKNYYQFIRRQEMV